MPANRSRTTQWRRCLQQIRDRNGAIEIAISRHYREGETGSHLIWRVRVLDVQEHELVVEQPMALGQLLPIQCGVELVGIIAVGQNRWMFTTTNIGGTTVPLAGRREVAALRLMPPERVERCQRRSYYRVPTASILLPRIDVWPLLDPRSVLPAERANELQYAREDIEGPEPATMDPSILPEVGPKFSALMLNLGGGGVGLRVSPEDSQLLVRHKLFWLHIALPPELVTPICATGKLVHSHMESSNHMYAGVAFDFTFNPEHQQFVVEQICRYIAVQQRHQLQRSARRSA